jgi:D-amino-acid dehydrogenase
VASQHVLIVGGGVIGLCTAYYAVRAGHRITIVERGGPEHDSCSLGNAGMIVPSHFVPMAAPGMIAYGLRAMWNPESPFYVRPGLNLQLADWSVKFAQAATPERVAQAAPVLRDLHLASRQCYIELAEEHGNDFCLEQRGLLMLCKTPQALHDEVGTAAVANALGIPADVLTPVGAARLEPNVRMDIAGAVHFPLDCHLAPQRFIAGLTRWLAEEGVTFVWNAEVTGWRAEGGMISAVRISRGEIGADEYVIAGGAWTPAIAHGLQVKVPMQAGKGYSMTLTKPRLLPRICAICVEARVAVTPMAGALRVGGTMEIAGLDESINPARVRGIVNAVPRYFPQFSVEDFDGLPVWRGLRPCSPDGLPYLGKFKRYRNLSVAAGHAMMGLSLGPITGKLMAQAVSGAQPSIDIALLSPDRYT